MKAARIFFLLWILPVGFGFWASTASGLIIYRFGGGSLPEPTEASNIGVDYFGLSWTDLDPSLGGGTFELDMDATAIRALKRNPGVNIAPGIEENGGSYVRGQTNGQVWDGNTETVWEATRYMCSEFDEKNYFLNCVDDFGTPGTVNIALGGLYLVDRIRIISGLNDPSKIVRTARVYMAQEQPAIAAYLHPRPYEPWLVEERDNRKQKLEIAIPPYDHVGFVQVTVGEHNEDWDVHEIEIYARGFVEQSIYISNILEFDQPMAWGNLRWSGKRGSRAKVYIQTRSGADDTPDVFWRFTGRGNEKIEVDHSEYGSLKGGEKAGITYDQDNWNFWSAPYDFADSTGTPVVSMSPRRYFQFKVDFLPQDEDEDGGEIGFLELRASVPVASKLVGEIWPVEVEVGQHSNFTYALLPAIRSGDAGFDQLEIETSSLLNKVNEVRIGDMVVKHEILKQDPHRLLVGFPPVEAKDSGALVEVDFVAQVLRYGTTFTARVSNSAQPLEVPQRVNAGDATAAYEGNRVAVATSVREQVLLQVRTEAAFFLTPNGDQVNDTVIINYDILEITGVAQVTVEVLDLSGRRVRQVYRGSDGIGEYARVWDGLDDAGVLVPPGVYLYRIFVDADKEKVEKAGVLHTAY